MKNAYFYETAAGKIGIAEQAGAVTNLFFSGTVAPSEYEIRETPLLKKAARQLSEYFAEKRTSFDLPLKPDGTEFEQKVWGALLTIPYGEVRTYGDIARQIGRPKACRAVGHANSLNPISIFIPCHRVIGANGKLTGYAGGLAMKECLLTLENASPMRAH